MRFVVVHALFAFTLWSLNAFAAPSFQIVVHPKNEVETVSPKFLADAFLKKVKFWENGESILPVDLLLTSPARAAFSEQILSRPVLAVKNYWQQMIFSGRGIPPAELKSEAQLVRYVLSHPNAVGYVSADTPLEGLKILTVQ